jgi:hypothetical protein
MKKPLWYDVKATQAQEYREAISRKRLGQTQYYRDESLWGGGAWPFGYRPKPTPPKEDGKVRFKLFPDPVTAPLVREAYDRIVNQGHSMGMICRDWNERGILTSKDYQRAVKRRGDEGWRQDRGEVSVWASSALGAILRKPRRIREPSKDPRRTQGSQERRTQKLGPDQRPVPLPVWSQTVPRQAHQ